jgi:hypothetical protein
MPKPYIIMPESHWVNALDAVREKTGTTGTISSEELAAEIGRISGSGIDTSDATATADKIFKDESAYVDGEKLIGTFTIDNELTEQNDLISQISTLVAQKATPPSTDTSDATATALDIAENKSAYVKGQKVEGALYDYRGNTDYWVSLTDSYQWSDNDWAVKFEIDDLGIFDSSTVFKMDGGELASGIGLTADKIAEGETIMGIEGTHSGGSGGGGSVEMCSVTITNNSSSYLGGLFAFYNSLENGSIIGKSSHIATYPTINALQGSVITIIEVMNIGVLSDYGMENCSISNGGTLLSSILDHTNVAICAVAIQLPKANTCTITFS